jgi:hypothetical protein
MGTYLASLVIYRGIFNASAPLVPSAGVTNGHAEVLGRVADASLARSKK